MNELLQPMTEFLVDHKCSFACVQGFQGQGLNCWLVGDQIELLFEDRIVGDLMMMELLAIKMNFCRQGSTDRSAGDRNVSRRGSIVGDHQALLPPPKIRAKDSSLPICPQGSNC